jgi:hypothetical protein
VDRGPRARGVAGDRGRHQTLEQVFQLRHSRTSLKVA